MAQQALGARPGTGARFYLGFAAIATLLIFVGFAPSYYLKGVIHAPPPLSSLTMAHGLVFTAWVVLFLTQAFLIGAGRPRLHRQLGMAGAMLFGAMVVLGLSTAITAGRLGHAPPGSPPPLVFMALPVLGIVAVAGLVLLALTLRSRRDWHQRLMIAGFVMIAQPGIGRLFIPAGVPSWQTHGSFLVVETVLAAAVFWDARREGRIHPAWMVAAGVLAVFHLAVTWAYAGSPVWMALATWMTQSG